MKLQYILPSECYIKLKVALENFQNTFTENFQNEIQKSVEHFTKCVVQARL
jgi:hypothetical protein